MGSSFPPAHWVEVPCLIRKGHALNVSATACRWCGLVYDVEKVLAPKNVRRRSSGRGTTVERVQTMIDTYGDLCWWCGAQLTDDTRTRDHLMPKALGGGDRPENIRLCCCHCNTKKGHQHPWAWIRTFFD